MKFLHKLMICSLSFSFFTANAFANCNLYDTSSMVILGANCDASTQSGAPLSVDPFESDFVKMVENGECTGIVYADIPMPECAAGAIMSADPTETYFIYQHLGGSGVVVDGGTLETITVVAEPGNNPFSIPWNWLVKFLGFADDETYNEIYDLNDIPSCDPNNLSNDYDAYSETA